MTTKQLILLIVAMLLCFAIIIVATASCANMQEQEGLSECEKVMDESVYRCIDKEAGIVCWITRWGDRSIDCLPIDQTGLMGEYR